MIRYQKTFIAILVVFLSLVFVAGGFARLSVQDIQRLRTELEARGATFTIGPNPATERDLKDLCGLVPPENWWVGAPFKGIEGRRGLPVSWNWCDWGKCTSVKNQEGCGACWAFATVGPLESNILIKSGVHRDLSEQYLVSCNTNGWDCGGGWWAHDYHKDKLGSMETEAGAVPEIEFSYVAWDAPCGGPYTHPWKIDNWGYVGSSASVPSVDAIKQAIMDYGPVSVAICAGSAFQTYHSDIFNTDESWLCGEDEVNHGVVLVGWDDNQGTSGVWFLRNSWGSNWGEAGYMRIEYGTSQIGYSANFIVYSAPSIAASFTGYPTSGQAPLLVNFTDQSTGSITSWNWNFGDNTTSTQQNPSHTYNDPGKYTVSLTVTGPGGSDTETKNDYITVSSPCPVAGFSGYPATGQTPLSVNFTDQSTGSITSWNWNFGDNTTSIQQNPSHTYNDPGKYTVSLMVTGPGGSDTETKNNYITVSDPPVAAFGAGPTRGKAPLLVNFTDQSTGDITSWNWNFGDNTTSAQQNPSHTYNDPGKYTVSLTVTGPGGSDTEIKSDFISTSRRFKTNVEAFFLLLDDENGD